MTCTRRQLLTYATGSAAAFALAPGAIAAVPTRSDPHVAEARIRAVAFDSYGTLFDVDSLGVLTEKLYPGKGMELSQLWRRKQIEYSWLRTLLGRYRDFAAVTEDGLVFATNKLKLELTPDKRAQLLAQYVRLDAFPDVVEGIGEFRKLQLPLVIVSNGTPEGLRAEVKYIGIEAQIDKLISVDSVRAYKTDPRIYLAGAKALKLHPRDICFVSSHSWDVIGAISVGYNGFWVNRGAEPIEELGVPIAHRGATLFDAARFVGEAMARDRRGPDA